VARLTTIGELAASIAHEINQPLSAIATNGHAAWRWLGHDMPNVSEATEALKRVIKDANRAGDIIGRIRALSRMINRNISRSISMTLFGKSSLLHKPRCRVTASQSEVTYPQDSQLCSAIASSCSPAYSGPPGSISGTAIAATVHTEGRRACVPVARRGARAKAAACAA
jgi:C4-dicarboxylate-specific signal transduction histidine kinase